jgi:hypothetical protein
MKTASILLSLALTASVASGQTPPPMVPVDDVSKLANPANRTIEKDHRIKNLVPERTPSGMTVYREAPSNPVTETEAPKTITPAPDPAISSASPKQSSSTIPSDKEESCKKLAPFARAAADMRQKGISLQAAETGTEVLFGKHTTPDGLEFAKNIVRTVYKNKLTTENAEDIFIASCKLMVFASELEKNKK